MRVPAPGHSAHDSCLGHVLCHGGAPLSPPEVLRRRCREQSTLTLNSLALLRGGTWDRSDATLWGLGLGQAHVAPAVPGVPPRLGSVTAGSKVRGTGPTRG